MYVIFSVCKSPLEISSGANKVIKFYNNMTKFPVQVTVGILRNFASRRRGVPLQTNNTIGVL